MLDTYKDLKVGDVINSDCLIKLFKCSNQGGMRYSSKINALVLISSNDNIYHDREESGFIYYTGTGTKGNQSFSYRENKRLFNSKNQDTEVHYFKRPTTGQYVYIGQVKLEDAFKEKQEDINGDIRDVCIFKLIPIVSETLLLSSDEVENKLIISNSELEITTKKRLIDARVGQGQFRTELLNLYKKCLVTEVELTDVLRASHIKPWKDCDNKERLDKYNGFIFAAHVDALFDKGYISFNDDGRILINKENEAEIKKLGINTLITIKIHDESRIYLKWHRKNIFISS